MAFNWLEYIPFGVVVFGGLGLIEKRLSTKVSKEACNEKHKVMDRLEVRIMRIEDHLFERPLTKKEADAIVRKNGK